MGVGITGIDVAFCHADDIDAGPTGFVTLRDPGRNLVQLSQPKG